jgi:SPP1 gp7 family putative phage head morphogenesis protein
MHDFVEPLVMSEVYRQAHYASVSKLFSQDANLFVVFFKFLFSRLLIELPDARTKGMVATIAVATSKQRSSQFRRVVRQSIGVDVVGSERGIDKVLSSFATDNQKLIKSIKTQYVNEVGAVVQQAVSEGKRAEEIQTLIQERGKVSKARARLIARDQIGKLTSQLDRQRHENAGITGYMWRGVRDNRERRLHLDREGVHFDYASPPKKTPDDGAPGIPINCRCYAEPDLESLLSDAEALMKGA